MTLNVSGAPSTVTSLKVSFTPNNNTAALVSTISLSNGNGSDTIMVSQSTIYNLSADSVSEYAVNISPQQLIPSTNATVTITFTQGSTPVAINGQLNVCGT